MAKPLGERVLPEEYIRTLKKPSNLSWQQFIDIAKKQFNDGQNEELKKQQEYEERTRSAMLKAEKIFAQNLKIKEEKACNERLAAAKKLREEEARKQKEEEECIRKENEEHLRQEEEERLKKEEQECLRREEEERLRREEVERKQREAEEERLRKEEEERHAKEEAENILKDSLSSFVASGSGTKSDPLMINSEEMFRELSDLRSKRLGIDHADIHLRQSIAELGALIMDEDIHFALRNLKELGIQMRKTRRILFEQEKEEGDHSVLTGSLTAVNSPILGTLQIKQENDVPNGVQMRSTSSLRSPPAQLFQGMKRHNEETFAGSMLASKRKKNGNTPSRGRTPASTPNRIAASTDQCVSQAEIKCKKADQGNTFLQTKKITKSNNVAIFKSVRDKERDIVKFTCGDDSFYKIMTFYYPALSMTPEDVQFKELKKLLFTFIMKNYDYTQVKSVLVFKP